METRRDRALGWTFLAGALVAGCGGGAPPVREPVGVSRPGPVPPAPAPAPPPRVERPHTALPEVTIAAKPPPCPSDMATLPAVCVDRFEAPNVKGETPLLLQTAYDGEAWCAARGKRLCTEAEWLRACQGAHKRRFPYGTTHRAHACNDDRDWIAPDWSALARWPGEEAVQEAARLAQPDPSGARPACVSEEGVYDLTGNAAEWVVRSFPSTKGYDHVLKGCYWAGCYKEPEPHCLFRNPAHPGTFRTYEAGFRCCRDRTDVAPTPRP